MIVFVAGASGVVGQRLLPLLRQDEHQVIATTRSPAKVAALRAQGATPVVIDVFDRVALEQAVVTARPDVIIHQLTDLPEVQDPAQAVAVTENNARLRCDGSRNLMAAAQAAGVKRVVAQSIAWAYAPGEGARAETDPLDIAAEGARAVSVGGVAALEEAVMNTPGVDGLVLRYGRFYGPGTWTPKPSGTSPLHVDAAAQVARLAVSRGEPGIYNIAEDDGTVLIEKARRAFGFDPDFRMVTT
ncbi:MAG: NAD(P)H-binding protein [Rhizobiales bacterium]|nr:NAD(P)H-binding protein [Hyphomicrobiales bacterium]